MYDMLKNNDINGVQLINICKSQMKNESAADVITDVMRFVIPVTIKSYIPLDIYEEYNHSIFEMLLTIISSGSLNNDTPT
jgi:hypothetical protein